MPLIPEEAIQQVLDRADIVDIVSLYLPLKKAGRNFKALSPFKAEKTPSFVVSPDKQIFHCFSTGKGGNVISFVMLMEKMDFPEAIRFLAKKVGVDIPEERLQDRKQENIQQQLYEVNAVAVEYFSNILLTDKGEDVEKVRMYLKERGLSLETVQLFQIGYALEQWDGLIKHAQKKDKDIGLRLLEKAGLIIPREKQDGYYDRFRNRVIFPIVDARGNCRAFGGRTMEKDNSAKYVNSPETAVYTKGRHLYGFQLAKDSIAQEDFAIIVEGYMDCIIPVQAGVKNVVASLGTALTVDQIRLLRRYSKNVVMLFDSDSAGVAAMIRSLDILIEEEMLVKVASLKEGEDPDSFINRYGADAFKKCIEEAKPLFD
ncbi:MAG: DNA primase, partial [Candidatus Omnitrophica bacterium]|nr:DNA primase [Candidatus Omnitrophota bacterium]